MVSELPARFGSSAILYVVTSAVYLHMATSVHVMARHQNAHAQNS